jgi:polysaccharide deacetylase family protein (PEP-CTERM system associated)
MRNILTIDLEDWYHCLDEDPANWCLYEDRVVLAARRVLKILSANDTRATFFVLGHVAERHPELIREIQRAGHEVGCHGYEHKFAYRQTPAEFESDVGRAARLLSSITGEPVLSYRAPYFSITRKSLWALPVLRDLGFKYDSSVFPVHNHRYGIPGAPRLPFTTDEGIVEVPVSTFPLARVHLPFAGGVYFRFFSYGFVRGMCRRLNARGESVVFYLHPWEVDEEQPRIRLPPALKLRHYWGLAHTAGKLDRLLKEFRFGPVREVLAS